MVKSTTVYYLLSQYNVKFVLYQLLLISLTHSIVCLLRTHTHAHTHTHIPTHTLTHAHTKHTHIHTLPFPPNR